MKKTDRLFDLSKSLNKNEKGYFKKFSLAYSKKEDSNQYIKLFDAIDRQKEYDEDPLIEQLSKGNKKFNFSAAKNFLYDRVLTSMESYHAARITTEIRSYLNQVELLMNKFLHGHAEKVLEKAEQQAEKYELLELMPDILLRKLTIWKVRKFQGIEESRIIETTAKLNRSLKNIQDLAQVYQFQSHYDFNYTSKGAIADAAQLAEFREFVRSFEQSGLAESESFPVQVGYLLLLNSMYLFSDEAEKAYKANLLLLEMFEADPNRSQHRQNNYHHTLARIIESQTALGIYDDAAANLDKLKTGALPGANGMLAFWNYYILLLEIMLLRASRDYKRLTDLIEGKADQYAVRLFESRNYDIQLKLNVADIYFCMEENEKVADILNEVLNNPKNGVRADFYCYSKLLLLLNYWEQGDLNLLPYELKSTRNFFETKLPATKTEKILLKFIEKHQDSIVNSRSLVVPFKALKEEITEAFTDRMNKRILDYIDVMLWIESKIQRVKMTDVKTTP